MYKYFLVLKYLFSRKINLLGMIGVAVSVWALILVVSIFSGFVRDARSFIRGAASDLSLVGNPLDTSFETVETLLMSDPAVKAVAPRIVWHAFLHGSGGSMQLVRTRAQPTGMLSANFVRVIGIDFEKEKEVTKITTWLQITDDSGFRVDDTNRPFEINTKAVALARGQQIHTSYPGLILGIDRTREPGTHFLRRGQRMTLASGHKVGRDKIKSVRRYFTLTGAFQSGHRQFDSDVIIVDIKQLRSVFGHDDEQEGSIDIFNEIAILLKDPKNAEVVAKHLNDKLDNAGIRGRVFTWEQRQAPLIEAVEQERGMMKIVLLALMVVGSFLIFATLSMMVTEKTRDIGVLASLGATRKGILGIFLLCGLTISVVGCTLGMLAGYVNTVNINEINGWFKRNFELELFPSSIYGRQDIPSDLDPLWFVQVSAGAILLALLFSYFPARRAAHKDPVQALRHE